RQVAEMLPHGCDHLRHPLKRIIRLGVGGNFKRISIAVHLPYLPPFLSFFSRGSSLRCSSCSARSSATCSIVSGSVMVPLLIRDSTTWRRISTTLRTRPHCTCLSAIANPFLGIPVGSLLSHLEAVSPTATAPSNRGRTVAYAGVYPASL